jgi:hypothetical protein
LASARSRRLVTAPSASAMSWPVSAGGCVIAFSCLVGGPRDILYIDIMFMATMTIIPNDLG